MPARKTSTLEKINNILSERLETKKPEDIKPHHDLRRDLGADSLDYYELAYYFEEELGVSISEEKGWEIRTVNEIYREVLSQLGEHTKYEKGKIINETRRVISACYPVIDEKRIVSRAHLWNDLGITNLIKKCCGRCPAGHDNPHKKLIELIEQKYDIKFDREKDNLNMETVGDFYRLVLSKAYPKDKQK